MVPVPTLGDSTEPLSACPGARVDVSTPLAAVVGAGQSLFGARPGGPRDLFAEALEVCLASVDKGIRLAEIRETWIGSLGFGGSQLGNTAAYLGEQVGLAGIPAHRVENACASSGFAFRDAVLAVASGQVDVALAGGVEKMNDLSGEHKRFWLGVSGDTAWERLAGLTFPGVYALMANRHMHDYGTTREHLAAVAVKNHRNGAENPKAQFQKAITLEQALGGARVADPLTVYDCCSTTDGASAVLVVAPKLAKRFTDTPVYVTGSAAASDFLALHDRASITALRATTESARAALKQAGKTTKDLQVAEVHDCFTIAELLAIEDLGLCEKGQGGPFTASGATARDGAIAVNSSGGLKAKGHPLGATGTAQVAEVYAQLRGAADKKSRQVPNAEAGLTHNVGGSGATCAVHVFSR